MHNIRLFPSLERTVARSDDCQDALYKHTRILASAARVRLSRHSTGIRRKRDKPHQITMSKGLVDHFVNLRGPAAMAVEEGHHAPDGSFVRGLRILRGLL